MKKVLFATTALVASAGIASAQGVEISGAAEMGFAGGGGGVNEGFYQSIDVFFDMTGETDNGLTFGASIDLEDATEQANNVDVRDAFADFTVFISGAFGNLTLGDTDGALDFVGQEANTAANPGSIDDAETSHAGYIGDYLDGEGTGQILRYDNTFGDFTVAVSLENSIGGGNYGWAIGAGYTLGFAGGDVTFGLGYQEAATGNANPNTGGGDTWDASAAVALDSGFEATVRFGDFDGGVLGGGATSYAIGLGYGFGPFGVHANYGNINPNAGADVDGYGLAASYDLGGGASLHGAYSDGSNNVERFSFGLAMSF